jgi:hypothetical protein
VNRSEGRKNFDEGQEYDPYYKFPRLHPEISKAWEGNERDSAAAATMFDG